MRWQDAVLRSLILHRLDSMTPPKVAETLYMEPFTRSKMTAFFWLLPVNRCAIRGFGSWAADNEAGAEYQRGVATSLWGVFAPTMQLHACDLNRDQLGDA